MGAYEETEGDEKGGKEYGVPFKKVGIFGTTEYHR